jgi:hypothetical protein
VCRARDLTLEVYSGFVGLSGMKITGLIKKIDILTRVIVSMYRIYYMGILPACISGLPKKRMNVNESVVAMPRVQVNIIDSPSILN